MQIAKPFNTQSWTIRAAEFAGWMACAALLYWNRWTGLSTTAHVALIVATAAYAFIRFCSLVHWYKDARRGEGIEQHFIQMKVIAVYGFLFATITAVIHAPSFLITIIATILTAISAINATMLYLHRKDTSTTPINYYSHKKFTQEDA